MFDDWEWLDNRSNRQENQFREWKHSIEDKVVATIELGAGVSGCSARNKSQRLFERLIRINPAAEQEDNKIVFIQSGALEALLAIDKILE